MDPDGSRADIGAYYFEAEEFAEPTDIEDFINSPIFRTYPNPTNSLLNIDLSITENFFISIRVVDSRGRFIRTLANGLMEIGQHKITSSMENLSSGKYFLIMRYNDDFEYHNLTLLR